jgi:pilus assembly protein Flp/PilA
MLLLIWNYLGTRLGDEDGATMVEYGIMVAVIALVAIVGATALGAAIDTLFSSSAASLP